MSKSHIKYYLIMYCAFFIYSISTICSKYAATQNAVTKIMFYISLELFFLAMYAFLWQQVLKKIPLVTAMANKGIVVILNLVWAVILFKEIVTWYNIVGALIIILGIWMVSASD